MKKLKKTQPITLTLFIIVVACLFGGLYVVPTLFIVLGVAFLMPKRTSFLLRLVTSYALFFVVNILIVLLLNKFDFPFEVAWLLGLYSLPLAFIIYRRRDTLLTGQRYFSLSDGVILGLAAVLFVLLINPLRGTYPEMLRMLSMAEDNASHYAMVHSNTTHKGYTYFMDSEESGLVPSLRIYSQGLHINMAINSLIVAGPSTIEQPFLIKSFVVQICTILCSLFMAILLCIQQLSRRFIKDRTLAIGLLATSPALIYYIGFGTNIYMFEMGFHTQIAAYSLLLLGLLWLSLEQVSLRLKLFVGAALLVGISFCWFFLLPVAGASFALWAWFTRKAVLQQWKRTPYDVLMLGALGLSALVPFIIDRINHNTTSLNTPGGVLIIILPIMGLYCCLGLLYLLTLKRLELNRQPLLQLILVVLLFNGLFAAAIAAYQLTTAGALAYYFYKTLFLFPILGILLSALFIMHYAPNLKLTHQLNRGRLSILCLLVFGFSYLFSFNLNTAAYTKFYLEEKLTYHLDANLLAPLVEANKTVTAPQKDYDFVVFDGCQPFKTYILQRWAGALLLKDGDKNRETLYQALLDDQAPESYIHSSTSVNKKVDIAYYDSCLEGKQILQIPENATLRSF